SVNGNLFPNPAGAGQPVAGPSSLTLPNSNLKPMRASEKEIGIELKMFQNRIGLDFAAYQKITNDQIVSAQVSDGSGYTSTLINSGKSRTNGLEMLLNLVPIKTGSFQWDLSFNGSLNNTKVLKLLTETPGERITVGTHVFNGELRQVVGQPMGQIYGFGYARDPQGRIIFGGNGIATRTSDLISFGSALPKWTGGINNGISYKNFTLSFLIDFKLGNNMLSGTNFNAVRHGLHKITLPGREGIIGEGVIKQPDGSFITNTVKANNQDYWSVVRSLALIEPVVYNGGFWKLRQITAGYDLTKLLPATSPIKALKLSLVANNVLMLKKWVPNIDPDSFGYSSDNLVGMESTGLPTTRSVGFNLNVKF
ncbi:MAG: TonB-dependent receptor, partial [Saprospiraceae bacterium]